MMIDLNSHYRQIPDYKVLARHAARDAALIPADATLAAIQRVKNSHRGTEKLGNLRELHATAVNQDFLDRICTLDQLERLNLNWPVIASDLSGLRNLKKLRHLRIDSPRAATDFSPLTQMASLTTLFIENAKHMTSLDWLVPMRDQLAVLGIEGSMWTYQNLDGLAPLAGFSFEALFLTTVRLKDTSLAPLAECPNLRYLSCARLAPKVEFDALKARSPEISCTWFDQYDIG